MIPALTIRQPFAWAVIYGGKDVENRGWRTSYRGPLVIHAAREPDPAAAEDVLRTIADPVLLGHPAAAWQARGAFIGLVFLAEIRADSPSPWAMAGQYNWVLEFPAPIDPPVPARGRPGLWPAPADVVAGLAHLL
jgi:hypothetical protein